MTTTKARVQRVDDDGIVLWGFGDRVVDVLFDERRVWSFWLVRDTEGGVAGRRTIQWPGQLRRFLDGRTRLTLQEHVSGEVVFDSEITLGSGEGRIAVVSPSGAPLGLDKSNRISATFSDRSDAEVGPLLDAIATVLDGLRAAGVEGFLAYGTLLGAVRENRLLGHDSDADLAYVSAHSHPTDVALESFRLQRRLTELGFSCYRYSGGAFRVDVVESDGMVRGLDVFGGFIDDDRLFLMGEVGADFRPEWIYPTTTCELEGRSFPVPARPEKLLAAMYGPSWRVPDPAFKFATPRSVEQRLSGWFRGTAFHRNDWERWFSGRWRNGPNRKPSRLARDAFAFVGQGGHVLDVGAGLGADADWLARQGVRVTAYDYVPRAMRILDERAREEGLPVRTRSLNLTEWRSVLSEGILTSRLGGRRAMLAQHVADATGAAGKQMLARFASMSLRGGGRLYVQVWTGEGVGPKNVHPVDLDELAETVRERGGRILSTTTTEPGAKPARKQFSMGRLVAQWD